MRYSYFFKSQYLLRFGLYLLFFLGLVVFSRTIIANDMILPENFHPVSPGVFRSSQPNTQMMQNLSKIGFKSILNLRQWHDDKDEAVSTGLFLHNVPMDAADINDENIIQALKIIQGSEKPILIHCLHGSDRTGAVVAMYRLVFENSDRSEVIAELHKKEYGYHDVLYANIDRYIKNVNIDYIKSQVLVP